MARRSAIARSTYLRGLLVRQLDAFQDGGLQLRRGGVDATDAAISTLRREIAAFDAVLAEDAGER